MENIASDQPPQVISVPVVPEYCFDDKDYCMRSEVLSGGEMGSAIGLKIFALVQRERGESISESVQNIRSRFFELDKWDEYALRMDETGKYLKFSRCDNVTDIAHKQGLPLDSYYQFMSYDIAGPLATRINVTGSYVYKELPAVQGSLLTGVSQLITDVSSMPVPSGVIAEIEGITWHWAVCNITKFKDDDDYLVFTVETQMRPELSFLLSTVIDPFKRTYMAVLGGMFGISMDFNDLN